MIEIDKPIIKEADDQFSRVDYVNSIANHIKNNKTKDCTIIGINGAWGTGKTSILNLLKKELQKQFFYTEEFNPWRYKSESQMLIKLFEKIHLGSKSDKKLKDSVKELGKCLLEYGEFVAVPEIKIGPFGVDFSNVAKGITQGIGKKLSKRKHTLEDVKERINVILSDLALPLIIFVDDIDRLDNTEIRQLFKLLKLTADFNNLIYIVAFDDEVVSNVLNADYLGSGDLNGGKEFLEKIINIPLPIPHLSNHHRHLFLVNRLSEFSSKLQINLFEDYEFNGRLRDCSFMLLKTPRDVKRVINSISFLRECLKQEVSINDLIILEILRLYAPEVFRQIIKFQDYLFNKSLEQPFKFLDSSSSTTETGDYFFSFIDTVRYKKTEIISIISYLFPSNTLFGSRQLILSQQRIKNLSAQNRVALKTNFDRYLKIGLLENELSTEDLDSIIHGIETSILEKSLIEVEKLSDVNFNQIFEYLKISEDSISEDTKYKLYQIYCISDYFNRTNEFDFIFGMSPIHHVFKNLVSLSNLDSFVIETIDNCAHPFRKFYLIVQFKEALELESKNQEILKSVEKIALEEIDNIFDFDKSQIFENPDDNKCHDIINLIFQFGKDKLFCKSVLKYIQAKGNVLKVARSILNKATKISDKPIVYYDDELSDSYFQRLEKLIDRDVLIEKFNELKDAYPLNYTSKDEIMKINGIIVNKYLDYVERTKGID